MRILLAEDERALAFALSTFLKRNNFSVDVAHNGQDALDNLLTGLYDIAVLDIMMPKMDGVTVLKKARASRVDIPVIMLTAKSELDDIVDGLDNGADDYITKPFEMRELLARIRAAMRRKTPLMDDLLTFGNLTLNRQTCEMSVGENSQKLGHKEYQILEMFMQHPKNVISSEHFMEKIWGYDSDAELSVVWVYISSLRKKLSGLNANVRIKASRNLGYYLEITDD